MPVPGREGPTQPRRPDQPDVPRPQYIPPAPFAAVPVHERQRARFDRQVWFPAGIGVADLGVAVLDQQPVPPIAWTLVGKGERDDQSAGGQRRSVELHLAPRPQRETGIGAIGGDLHPALAPLREPVEDAGEIGAGFGELIEVAAASRVSVGTG